LIEAELTASLLGDSDWETRAAIAHSLGALGLVSAFPALTEALGDRDRRVRLASLQTMARLDLQQTAGLEEVKALSRGGDQATKAAARRILKQARAAEVAGADPSPPAGAAPAE
jgi:HEAT repeat protein